MPSRRWAQKRKHQPHIDALAAFDFGSPATAERPGRGILGQIPFRLEEYQETVLVPNILGVLEERVVFQTRSNHASVGLVGRLAREIGDIFRSLDGETEATVQAFTAVANNPHVDPRTSVFTLARREAEGLCRRVESNLTAAQTKLANLAKIEEQVQTDLDGATPTGIAAERVERVPMLAGESFGIVDSATGQPASGRMTGGDVR